MARSEEGNQSWTSAALHSRNAPDKGLNDGPHGDIGETTKYSGNSASMMIRSCRPRHTATSLEDIYMVELQEACTWNTPKQSSMSRYCLHTGGGNGKS
ncbi:hypothetical protein GOP47_0019788 [Adiantum capillus-veneris]|uniref:Uncharacterized protein n=1 Tax=Adiantum capillus-veneris TaxID=13818 RepID=A0A9D4Z7D5_ADICA|nr:hypothetical protein GOP47_0019788 [Adiantum capillus-veneris]